MKLSPAARALLEEARIRRDVPETHGVRISARTSTDGNPVLRLRFCERPEDGDVVRETRGLRIFLPSGVASLVDGSTLDVRASTGGDFRFVLRQPTNA